MVVIGIEKMINNDDRDDDDGDNDNDNADDEKVYNIVIIKRGLMMMTTIIKWY